MSLFAVPSAAFIFSASFRKSAILKHYNIIRHARVEIESDKIDEIAYTCGLLLHFRSLTRQRYAPNLHRDWNHRYFELWLVLHLHSSRLHIRWDTGSVIGRSSNPKIPRRIYTRNALSVVFYINERERYTSLSWFSINDSFLKKDHGRNRVSSCQELF